MTQDYFLPFLAAFFGAGRLEAAFFATFFLAAPFLAAVFFAPAFFAAAFLTGFAAFFAAFWAAAFTAAFFAAFLAGAAFFFTGLAAAVGAWVRLPGGAKLNRKC